MLSTIHKLAVKLSFFVSLLCFSFSFVMFLMFSIFVWFDFDVKTGTELKEIFEAFIILGPACLAFYFCAKEKIFGYFMLIAFAIYVILKLSISWILLSIIFIVCLPLLTQKLNREILNEM